MIKAIETSWKTHFNNNLFIYLKHIEYYKINESERLFNKKAIKN